MRAHTHTHTNRMHTGVPVFQPPRLATRGLKREIGTQHLVAEQDSSGWESWKPIHPTKAFTEHAEPEAMNSGTCSIIVISILLYTMGFLYDACRTRACWCKLCKMISGGIPRATRLMKETAKAQDIRPKNEFPLLDPFEILPEPSGCSCRRIQTVIVAETIELITTIHHIHWRIEIRGRASARGIHQRHPPAAPSVNWECGNCPDPCAWNLSRKAALPQK